MTPLESGLLLTSHCLDPAEGFLDPLADTLADRIAGVARRAPWRVAVSVSGAPPQFQPPYLGKSKTKIPASQPAARSSTSGWRSAFTVSR